MRRTTETRITLEAVDFPDEKTIKDSLHDNTLVDSMAEDRLVGWLAFAVTIACFVGRESHGQGAPSDEQCWPGQ